MFTRLGMIVLCICAFGCYVVFSSSDYTEAKKSTEPVKSAKVESFAEYQARIDKVKEYVLERQTEALLTEDRTKK